MPSSTSNEEVKINVERSPEIELRVIEAKLESKRHQQQHDLDDVWRSCCFSCNKMFVIYFTQMSIIFSVMTFCSYQLITLEDCGSQHAYLGLLSVLIGLVIPNPKIVKGKYKQAN